MRIKSKELTSILLQLLEGYHVEHIMRYKMKLFKSPGKRSVATSFLTPLRVFLPLIVVSIFIFYVPEADAAWLKAKVGTFTANSGTGSQQVTGVGFQPKAVLFWITDRTSVGSGDYARFGRGWADGTNEAATATAWENDADSSATRDRIDTLKCITLIDHSGNVLAEADISSLDSDGFTISWSTAGGSRLVTYLALGGDALTNANVGGFIYPGDSLDYSETGVGFQPDAVLLAGVELTGSFGTTTRGGHGFGIALSSTERQSSAHRWRNGLVDLESSSSGITDTFALILADDSPTPEMSFDLVSMDSDGFTVTPDLGGDRDAAVVYLALKGIDIDRGILSQPTSTGNQSVTGLSFRSTVVLFDGGDKATTNVFEQDAEMVAGVATSSTERAAFWIGCNSDASPYPSDTDLRTNAVIRSLTAGTPTLNAAADFVSMNSDGFTINWTTADATARKIGWIALGPTEPTTNYRSIGTNTGTLYSTGTASISSGDTVVTFSGASLPTNIGQGDSLTLDPGGGNEEVFYILSRDSESQVTVQSAATSGHSGESYSIERAFNTIQAWETARDGDLVAGNRLEVGVCYKDGSFNELVTIDGSTTDTTHYMHLTVAEGQRHDGTAGTGVVWKNTIEDSARVLQIYDQYTRVEWLEFDCSEMPSGDYDVVSFQVDSIYISKVIVHDLDGNYVNAFEFWSGGTDSRMENCIAYNLSGNSSTSFVVVNQTGVVIDNCTFYNNANGTGIEVTSGSPIVRNTICMDAALNDFNGTFNASSSNNLSSDATAPGSNSLTNQSAADQFADLTSGSEDLHLNDNSDAINAGTDLSATFTDDIDGETREGTWDIGADEYWGDWLSGWAKRVKIAIDHTDITSALSNFPVLIYLSDSSGIYDDDVTFVFDELGSDANRKKIAVTTDDGETQCYVEVEKWDHASEKAWLWVKIPSISSSVDTDLYLYYDSSHADNTANVGDVGDTPAQAVWDSNFTHVYHLNETSGGSNAIKDATSNAHHGTDSGSPTFGQTGKIHKAIEFNAGSDKIDIPYVNLGSSLTYDMWFKNIATSGDNEPLAFMGSTFWFSLSWDNIKWYPDVYASGTTVSYSDDNNWHHIVIFQDGTTCSIWIDGVAKLDGGSCSAIRTNNDYRWIGRGTSSSFDGLLDEVRISNIARDGASKADAWIKASYESGRDDLLDFGGEAITMAEVVNFSCIPGRGSVILRWDTTCEQDNEWWRIYRSTSKDTIGEMIARLKGAGTSPTPTSYEYVDKDIEFGTTYYYRIADVNSQGVETFHGPVQITPGKPFAFTLFQNYPNPYYSSTTIMYEIPKTTKVSLRIYDITGALMRTLVDKEQTPNRYKVVWDGNDNRGNKVSGGVYFYRLEANGKKMTKKMVLME